MTVVALAWLVHEALAAAEELEPEGISVEVVDPRTLVPLDRDAIRASVRKTGRLVIADEAGPTAGFSAEVAALATEAGADPLQPDPRKSRVPGPQADQPRRQSAIGARQSALG